MALRDITTASVISAIAEYDDIGQIAFLSKYGFRRARKFILFYDGKTYDSEAIAGAAHQYATGQALPPAVFSGGAETVRPLLALGFDVRDTSAQNAIGKLRTDERHVIDADRLRHHASIHR